MIQTLNLPKEKINILFDTKKIEEFINGIVVKAEISKQQAIVDYISVKNREYYIDVWNCTPRLAKRSVHKNNIYNDIIELKEEKSIELFYELVELRDVIINMSGHYYIESQEQNDLLNKILEIEKLK